MIMPKIKETRDKVRLLAILILNYKIQKDTDFNLLLAMIDLK